MSRRHRSFVTNVAGSIGAISKTGRDPLIRTIAHRMQELAYGGLKPETLKRLAALADELEPRSGARGNDHRPIR